MISFKQFNEDTVITHDRVYMLNESISHLEDLAPEEFLHAVKNLTNLIATEKLDGANMIVGIDNDGKMYTSRETKGGGRTYEVNEPIRPAENGFCAAHAALDQVKSTIKSVLAVGDAVEVEVLFGRQPNAIVYGSNYIAFLRMIPGDNQNDPDQTKVRKLHKALEGKKVTFHAPIISTTDGLELQTKETELTFKFVSTALIDSFEFHKVDIKQELHNFEVWLHKHPPSSFKTKKAFAEAASEFMLPIKEKLVDNILRKLKPAYRDVDIEPSEDIGIEGIVVLDPKTGKQFKIVDKSVFTIINQFNYAIRNEIKSTSRFSKEAFKHLYKEFNATTGVNGSVYDEMLHQMAQVIGIPGLGSYMDITRTIKKYPSPEAFVKAFPQDVNKLRAGITHAIHAGLQHLDESKKHFEANWRSFVLTLGNGRKIMYSKEVYNRTLLVYAEAFKELTGMLREIQNARTVTEIANTLFGKQLKALR